jgi:hypothetical protein
VTDWLVVVSYRFLARGNSKFAERFEAHMVV